MQPDNAEIARITVDCFNTREFEKGAAYLSDEMEWTEVPSGEVFRGPSGFIREYTAWTRAFPDGRVEITNLIDAGDWIVVENVVRGTNTGPMLGPDGEIPATGKFVEVKLCDVMRLRDGKVVEGRSYFDLDSLQRQLD